MVVGVVTPEPTSTRSRSPRPFASHRERDDESGLMHFRARSYDPRLGRFVQKDRGIGNRFLSSYSYAKSNPQVYRDPMGLQEKFSTRIDADVEATPVFSIAWPRVRSSSLYRSLRSELEHLSKRKDILFYIAGRRIQVDLQTTPTGPPSQTAAMAFGLNPVRGQTQIGMVIDTQYLSKMNQTFAQGGGFAHWAELLFAKTLWHELAHLLNSVSASADFAGESYDTYGEALETNPLTGQQTTVITRIPANDAYYRRQTRFLEEYELLYLGTPAPDLIGAQTEVYETVTTLARGSGADVSTGRRSSWIKERVDITEKTQYFLRGGKIKEFPPAIFGGLVPATDVRMRSLIRERNQDGP